jgi:hypothetical protein
MVLAFAVLVADMLRVVKATYSGCSWTVFMDGVHGSAVRI